MDILIVIFGVILVIVALLLFVPFRVSLYAGYRRRWNGSLRVRWLWGLLAATYLFREKTLRCYLAGIPLFRITPRHKEKEQKRSPPRKKAKRQFPFTLGTMICVVKKTLRSLMPEGAISGTFGTGDPAETGMIYGTAVSVLGPFPVPVTVTPDFQRSVLAVNCCLAVRVHIAQLVIIMANGYLHSRKQGTCGMHKGGNTCKAT